MALLETSGLTAFYGDFQALFGVDIALEPGETVAIIGANGAGKTTLLRSIAGVARATQPDMVRFDGDADRRPAGRRRSSRAASPWCRRGGGCFPRSASRKTC